MIYLINLIYSSILSYLFDKTKNRFFIFLMLCIWSFIIGGQYGVGTDYFSYLDIFSNENVLYKYFLKKEYLFYYFVNYLKFIQNKQWLFFFIAIIENYIFYKLLIYLKKERIIENTSLFVFIFLTYGTTFYNQMNGIRQYFNVYLLTYLVIFGYEKRYLKYLIVIVIGMNIHASFIIFLPIVILVNIVKKISLKKILIILLMVVIFNFLPLNDILKKIATFSKRYHHYIYSEYFEKVPLKGKITKIIYIPFYIQATTCLKNDKKILANNKLFFLKFGLISFSIKIFCLHSGAFNRIGESFGILILFPIYYLLEYSKKKKKIFTFIILFFLIIYLFIVKVFLFPSGEYLYRSYFFITK